MVIPSSIIWPLRPPVQKPAHLLDTSVQALLPYRCTHRLCTFRLPMVRLRTCVLHRFCWLERLMEHFPASQRPPGGLGAGRACCLFRAKVLRLGSPVCGRVGSRYARAFHCSAHKALHRGRQTWTTISEGPAREAGRLVAASTASWNAAEVPASWPPLCLLDVVQETHRCCIHLASARWPCSTSQDASLKLQTRSASKPARVLYKLAILHAAKT
ncbi:uncharacterized protein LOC144152221 isoform X1 [Haemaphysalis longicornis]